MHSGRPLSTLNRGQLNARRRHQASSASNFHNASRRDNLDNNGLERLLLTLYIAEFSVTPTTVSLRKEVIQPQVLLRLPCYDFTPIMNHTLGRCLLAVSAQTSSTIHFRDVTGGVYKARERIHGIILIYHY
jgi:hypothetical protein